MSNNNIINLLKKYNTDSIDFNNLFENIKLIDIIKLYYNDYVIFLTSKFFDLSYFNFKWKLLKYFSKYDILYFNYENKNKIRNIINIINNFIIKSDSESKNEFINEFIKINDENNKINFLKKMKLLYISDNIFEANILYKKIEFSNQEIFISFDSYIIKKTEYKLRTFCQIAENLGAVKIVILYEPKMKKSFT